MLKLAQIKAILEQYHCYPSKKLGQNFLIDPNLIDLIVRQMDWNEIRTILEVGPGLGALTELLVQVGLPYIGIEYDLRLMDFLQTNYSKLSNVHLIAGDAATYPISSLIQTYPLPWGCFANMPYSAATPILANLIQTQPPPFQMVLLLQSEMADRLAAKPGNKVYGSLSVKIQLLYKIELLREIPPEVFWPAPEVNSKLLRLTYCPVTSSQELYKACDRLVTHCFLERRKTIQNRLKKYHLETTIPIPWEAFQCTSSSRPEDLSPQQFLQLTEWLLTHRTL